MSHCKEDLLMLTGRLTDSRTEKRQAYKQSCNSYNEISFIQGSLRCIAQREAFNFHLSIISNNSNRLWG